MGANRSDGDGKGERPTYGHRRAYRIHYPPRQAAYRDFCAFMMVVGLCTVLFFAVTDFSFLEAFPGGSAILIIAIWLLLTGASMALAVRNRHARFHKPAGRMKRLACLVERPQVVDRLPHRLVEHFLRRHAGGSRRKYTRLLSQLPPGTLIVANGATAVEAPLPKGVEVAFEPIGIYDADDRLLDLVVLGYKGQDMGERESNELILYQGVRGPIPAGRIVA